MRKGSGDSLAEPHSGGKALLRAFSSIWLGAGAGICLQRIILENNNIHSRTVRVLHCGREVRALHLEYTSCRTIGGREAVSEHVLGLPQSQSKGEDLDTEHSSGEHELIICQSSGPGRQELISAAAFWSPRGEDLGAVVGRIKNQF